MKRISKSLAASLAFPAIALSGCYVVPVVDPNGNVQYHHYPLPPVGTHMAAGAPGAFYPGAFPVPPAPVSVPARLYPANDIANQTGMISGSVTNMRTGKGRFQLNYQGETLVGEATRHGNDDKHGVASAYGSGGTSMQCEYQMNTPVQGAGTCTFSSGARYKLHIGS
jgi:hypothetical protein